MNTSNKIAIIGGSSLSELKAMKVLGQELPDTPFGQPEAPLMKGIYQGADIVFMNRRGDRRVPPHRINYRANIWALHKLGVTQIISVFGMGGIRADMVPGKFAVPDQLIDYTSGRDSTYYDDCQVPVEQIDFTYPFCKILRKALTKSARKLDKTVSDEATIAVTQGPRFETLAEIKRLERDACDVVSMTPVPEVVLARELDMQYACLAFITRKAAGRRGGIDNKEEYQQIMRQSMFDLQVILAQTVNSLHKGDKK